MIKIREMLISDYEAVIELWSKTESLSLKDADSKQGINSYLVRNKGLSFVALFDHEVVGALLVGTDGRRGYLQHLAVSNIHRGKGVGKNLVSEATSALSSIGILKTHLFVLNKNVKAQEFYVKCGWFPREEIRMYSFNSTTNANV